MTQIWKSAFRLKGVVGLNPIMITMQRLDANWVVRNSD